MEFEQFDQNANAATVKNYKLSVAGGLSGIVSCIMLVVGIVLMFYNSDVIAICAAMLTSAVLAVVSRVISASYPFEF